MSDYDYDILNVVEEIRGLAEVRLSGEATVELLAWADDDYQVTAFHTIDATYPFEAEARGEEDGLPFYRERLRFSTTGDEEGWTVHEVVRAYCGRTRTETVWSERVGGYTPIGPPLSSTTRRTRTTDRLIRDPRSRGGSRSMSGNLDYREIDYPTDKPRSEWGHAARRAYILEQELEEVGHPDLINWSRLAREFDKSKSTLHNDKEKLLEYVVDETDEERVKQIGLSIFEKGLLRISSDDDYDPFDEASFFKMWASTLDEFGLIDLDDDAEDDLFTTGGEASGVTVQIAGVSADDVDESELPEQDRPDPDEDEEEAVEA